MYRCFYPNLTGVEAERLLLKEGQEGSFLIRPSGSSAGQFSLSVRGKDKDTHKDKVTHLRIRHVGNLYDLHGGEQFPSLSDLIKYYSNPKNELREMNGDSVILNEPLNSSNQPTERWFHGSLSGHDAKKIMLERGEVGSFLVRESQSKLGDYSLTVRHESKEKGQPDEVTHFTIRHHEGRYDIGGDNKFKTLSELIDHFRENHIVTTENTVIRLIKPLNSTRFNALDIETRIKELSKEVNEEDGFWEEFDHLQDNQCKILLSRKVGQEDKNVSKNRYRNILPFDYTRVILKGQTIYKESDYINANYIKLVEGDVASISPKTKSVPHSKLYIATQGPLPTTINDFWWMVWQEKSDCIAMVTKEVEYNKNKCSHYWPTSESQTMDCGLIKVKMISEKEVDDFICRELELRYLENNSNRNSFTSENKPSLTRRVIQYQYTDWPDQSIPNDPSSVLNFLSHINQNPPKGPMIVHCSGGIGRSGTLIVIDMLIDQLRIKNNLLNYEIDIQGIVRIARAQRFGLVQTEAQYKFIYLAIQNFITKK